MTEMESPELAGIVEARLLGYPDLSEGGIATATLLSLTDEEVELLHFFYTKDRRLPGVVYGFARELVKGYGEFDPERKFMKAQSEVLEVLDRTNLFIDIFTKRQVVPMLGIEPDTGGLLDFPREGWDVLEVTLLAQQIAQDALPKIERLKQKVLDPTAT